MNKKNYIPVFLIIVLVLTGLRLSTSQVSASIGSRTGTLVTTDLQGQGRPNTIPHSIRHNPEAGMVIRNESNAEFPVDGILDTSEANRHIQPASPLADTVTFLPLILKAPISGRVTDNGVPVEMQEVLLRFYDGSGWYTYSTAVTDGGGHYIFSSTPTLVGEQMYYVRWDNVGANPNRLSYWICNTISANSPLSANTCNFDVKDIPLSSPADGVIINLPQTFTWTPRGFGDDSYELVLFDLFNDVVFETYPPLGNVNSFSLNNRPAGFSTGIAYGWDVGVSTMYGWGESNFYNEITFSGSAPGPQLSGRVTNNGSSASGQSLMLRFYDGANWWTYDTTNTNNSGNYTFKNLPLLGVGQFVYVRWDNVAKNSSRLWTWRCYQIGVESYIREYTCNFDLKNISLVSPADSAIVPLPAAFTWTPRGFTSDSYELDLFDPTDVDPLFYTPLMDSTTSSYTLTSLPAGFLPFVQYGWDMFAVTPYDGYGESYYYYNVTFSNSGSSVASVIQTLPKPGGRMTKDPMEYPRP